MVLIFADKATGDAYAYEIAVTPGGVATWFDPNDTGHVEVTYDEATGETAKVWIPPKNAISYNTADNGRVAISHHWGLDDVAWLQEYLADVEGVTMADSLPKDWSVSDDEQLAG